MFREIWIPQKKRGSLVFQNPRTKKATKTTSMIEAQIRDIVLSLFHTAVSKSESRSLSSSSLSFHKMYHRKSQKKNEKRKLKKNRFSAFATFLIDTFPQDSLDLIIDVGGGGGKMGELLCSQGFSTIVVDPACKDLSSKFPQYCFEFLPIWHQKKFDDNYCFAEDGVSANSEWRSASLVIGMHPDEATESIIDNAIKSGKPFAVVPCCVFPSLFPDRLKRDGSTVRSYDDFIAYLQHKSDKIQRSQLIDVIGRNVVLYSLS